jgi:flagellar protein FlgJ
MKVTDLNTNVLLPIPRTGSVTAGKKNAALNEEETRLMETCRDFEAIFMGELLKSMRKTVPQGGMLANSFGQDVFQSMLDDEYAKQMASSHSTGLAEILFQQLRPKLNPSSED